ncbi:hypothetical protein BGW38_004209 [Lunasporangiospora selenospora]|uniref:Chitin-binding type-3 domain-containing protein n=1 Tax=Lunasporangiospora selenospora TaxID=979761 RepID=A0A9P6KHL0_9FUNG|nr:hypothetical protein BGW38_004209 [Lunasporangiospora selenospora]
MRLTTIVFSVVSAASLFYSAEAAASAAGYLLLNPNNGPAKLKALADNAATIPVNRIFLAFARPGMVYVPGSNTLEHVGLSYVNGGDFGFADLKAQVAKLQAGGVEVFLSMGGWNYGCFPYVYTYYSVGGYGTSTPNYYKIIDNGGSLASCTEANMWCYTCEPKSEGTVLADFDVFPEPSNSTTWKQAQDYVRSKAGGDPPVFHPEMIPGRQWKDSLNGQTNLVPGSDYYIQVNRDPYQDLVYLGKDLGLAGIDIDYEEMWHADYYKKGPATGPWTSHQTVYKYTAIMKDVEINIKAIAPNLKIATAASAAGGLSTNWWGGNLKNIWYNMFKWYPDAYNFIANSGGVNVMTYDLSNNQQFHECPDTNVCSLSQQVLYYMNSYKTNGMTAYVGYEIGIPAYPAFDHDPTHQLPLTQTELTAILAGQGSRGGFFWELYKSKGQPNNLEATAAAQQICKAALGATEPRCGGVIPPFDGSPTTTIEPTTTGTPSTTTPTVPTTTTNPGCTIAAWNPSTAYNSGAQVSYNGRVYSARWWSQNNKPTDGLPWEDKGACGGTTQPTGTPGSCNGVAAWSAGSSYSGGAKVSYNGFLYTASWWTQGDTPGSSSVWVKGAACGSALRRRRLF